MYQNNSYDIQMPNQQNSQVVKNIFSRTSFLTLTVSTAAFSLFFLLYTIVACTAQYKIPYIYSLYYFFGDNSISLSNLIFGIFIFALFIILSVSFMNLYKGAKSNDDHKLMQGINMTLASLIYMVILLSCIIITALASVSVVYYQRYSYYSNYQSDFCTGTYTGPNADNMFLICVVFGSIALCLSISLIRLILSIKRTVSGQPISAKGSLLALISAICGSLTMCIVSISSLCSLVMPYNYISKAKTLDSSVLLMLMLTVLFSVAMTIMLLTLSILVSIYMGNVNKLSNGTMYNYYTPYSTNMYNQTQSRTPYVNPVQPTTPSQPAKPYTKQTHQQYMQQFNSAQPAQNNYQQSVSNQFNQSQQNHNTDIPNNKPSQSATNPEQNVQNASQSAIPQVQEQSLQGDNLPASDSAPENQEDNGIGNKIDISK